MLLCSVAIVPAHATCGTIWKMNWSNCYGNGKVDLSWQPYTMEQNCTWAGYKIEKQCNGGAWEVIASLWQQTSYTYTGPCCAGHIKFRVSVVCNECDAGVPSEFGPIFCGCVAGGD
jgi:hypothetical protein